MDKHSDGGPAFPAYVFSPDVTSADHHGMTLRDHFAGQALAGIATYFRNGRHSEAAALAYRMADAMLKARDA